MKNNTRVYTCNKGCNLGSNLPVTLQQFRELATRHSMWTIPGSSNRELSGLSCGSLVYWHREVLASAEITSARDSRATYYVCGNSDQSRRGHTFAGGIHSPRKVWPRERLESCVHCVMRTTISLGYVATPDNIIIQRLMWTFVANVMLRASINMWISFFTGSSNARVSRTSVVNIIRVVYSSH